MTELLPFQKEALPMIYRFRGRALIADEQGLGKTLEALAWCTKIPKHRPVVVITPSSAKYTWQCEAKDHFRIRMEVLEGRCPDKSMTLEGEFFVINYDILTSWLRPLQRLRPKVIIADECQFIKNMEAARTRAVHRLARWASSVLALSGTPLTARPVELWSVLALLRPDIFPDRHRYLWRYCQPRHTRWGWIFRGAAHLGELHQILRRECMIRRRKKDVMPDLPPKIHKVVPFKLRSYKVYHEARDKFVAWVTKNKGLSRAKKAQKNQALTRIGYLLRLCADLKKEWVIRWLEDFVEANPGKKLVCMTMHSDVIAYLKKEFPNSVVIDGKTRGRLRFEAVRKFQNNSKTIFLFGNWRAAGVALTLTASHNMVSLDFPWTAGDLQQGQDRVHRIGQKMPVLIYYLVALGTIEEDLMRGLRKKTKILDAVLDGGKGARDFDMFDELIERISR